MFFYGSSTVGERGQIVIPAEARAEVGLAPGDKVLVVRHPFHRGLMMFKLEAMREVLDELAESYRKLEEERMKETESEDNQEES